MIDQRDERFVEQYEIRTSPFGIPLTSTEGCSTASIRPAWCSPRQCFFTSWLPGEPGAGVDDVHFTLGTPRAFFGDR